MRSTPQLLAQQLSKGVAPFYLLYGAESFLIEESATLIRQRIRSLGEIEQVTLTLDQSENAANVLNQLEQPSLFASIRLIEVKFEKPNASLSSKLAKILENEHIDTYFIFHAGSLSRQNQQAQWFTLIEQKGVVIPHWPLSSLQFSKWVEQKAKQRGLSLSAQTLLLLVYHTEGNCLAASQEIERLALAHSETTSPIDSQFSQQSQFEVFDLCEAALSQQPSRVIKIVSCLKESGVALQLILWALSQTVRTLNRCAITTKEPTQQLRQAGIRPQSQAIYLQRLKGSPATYWSSLLPYLSQADKQLKSGETTQAWQNVLNMSLKLAGNLSLPSI
ncbi:MAG: DNA polymerase III subunit delta [Gammaproteobacteria bacterium 39-13]|nr:DNA polymerase III subunit delta [Gammaproteobacteria bacterium]OJV96025.1 MAG: DNA polymerase III subunit delta [Gammaproteobacteria bacterium 39-13]